KSAATRFTPQQVYRDASLVQVELETGRTHQIRVHAAHIKHPLAGDDKYGDWEFNRRMKAQGLKRLFLHAHQMAFTLPGGRKIKLSAPLPADLQQVLDGLEI
ncbi:MAG: pseudouridine synthase, partial [Gammaproteobacteria bacterium]